MRHQELLKLANQAIAKWEKQPIKLGRFPVVQVLAEHLADEIEICPNIVGKYIGSTAKGHVYNIPAIAIVNNIKEHITTW